MPNSANISKEGKDWIYIRILFEAFSTTWVSCSFNFGSGLGSLYQVSSSANCRARVPKCVHGHGQMDFLLLMFFRCMMYTNIIYTYTRIILENNNRHKRTNLSLSLSKKSSCVFKNNMWFSNFCILQVICIICILHNEASRPRLTHDSQTEQTERRGFLTPLTELQDGRGGFWIWILEDFPLLLLLLFFSGGKSNDLVNSILFPYIQFIVFFGSLEDFGKSIDDERCGFGRIERFPTLAGLFWWFWYHREDGWVVQPVFGTYVLCEKK